MARKIIGVTVGTPMSPQRVIEKTVQAEQIAQNTRDIEELRNSGGGKDGKDGKSAYEYAQDGGYTGTEEEFAEHLANIGQNNGGASEEQIAQITKNKEDIVRLSGEKIDKPKDSDGNVSNGASGQILQTNGDGTTQWIDMPSGGTVETNGESVLYPYDWNYSAGYLPLVSKAMGYNGGTNTFTQRGLKMNKPYFCLLDDSTIGAVENFDMELIVSNLSTCGVQMGLVSNMGVDFKIYFENATYISIVDSSGGRTTECKIDNGTHSYRFIKNGTVFKFVYDGEVIVENTGRDRNTQDSGWWLGMNSYGAVCDIYLQRVRFKTW